MGKPFERAVGLYTLPHRLLWKNLHNPRTFTVFNRNVTSASELFIKIFSKWSVVETILFFSFCAYANDSVWNLVRLCQLSVKGLCLIVQQLAMLWLETLKEDTWLKYLSGFWSINFTPVVKGFFFDESGILIPCLVFKKLGGVNILPVMWNEKCTINVKDLVLIGERPHDLSEINNLSFFYLSFLSRPFANHIMAGERGGHFFNSSLPFPPASQALRH